MASPKWEWQPAFLRLEWTSRVDNLFGAAVGERRLATERVERKLAAILAVGALEYSSLASDANQGTFTRLKLHRRELPVLEMGERNGRIAKITGEGLLG